jgi:EpsI family protein
VRSYQGRLVTLAILLAVANAAAWAISLGRSREAPLRVDFSPIPRDIEGWHGTDVPQSEAVLRQLAADALLQRVYTRQDTRIDFWLVLGRDWRDLHSPEACYLSGQWRITGQRSLEIPVPNAGTEPLKVRLFLARKGEETILAVYFFATGHGAVSNRASLGWSLLKPGSGGRGLLLHAATPLGGDESIALGEITAFIQAVYPKVAEVLEAAQAGAK